MAERTPEQRTRRALKQHHLRAGNRAACGARSIGRGWESNWKRVTCERCQGTEAFKRAKSLPVPYEPADLTSRSVVEAEARMRGDGRDPVTGMVRESIEWALLTVRKLQPTKGEDLAHQVNTLAALADAFLRAGGTQAKLRTFEGDGFTFDNFWDVVEKLEGGRR